MISFNIQLQLARNFCCKVRQRHSGNGSVQIIEKLFALTYVITGSMVIVVAGVKCVIEDEEQIFEKLIGP